MAQKIWTRSSCTGQVRTQDLEEEILVIGILIGTIWRALWLWELTIWQPCRFGVSEVAFVKRIEQVLEDGQQLGLGIALWPSATYHDGQHRKQA